MHDDGFLFVRIIFGLLFIATLLSGGYLAKNYDQFFGIDPNMPSENESARAYHKFQVFVIWAHAVIFTGAFAIWLA
jgi:hypothetical protein